MSELQAPEQAPAEAVKDQEPAPAEAHWGKLIEARAPRAPELVELAVQSLSMHSTKALWGSTGLLALIVIVLTSLAAFALYGDHVDTAEKIIIAMVSFLGGVASFGGSKK